VAARRRRGRPHPYPTGPWKPFVAPNLEAEAAARLVLALKRRVDLGRFSADDAVAIALLQLTRPGGPRLSAADRHRLHAALTTLSTSLSPPTPRAIYSFAKDAAAAAWRLHHTGRSPSSAIRERADGDIRALAEAAVYAEFLNARGDEDLVRRAVTRAWRERRRGSPGRPVPLGEGDPLRTLLELPAAGRLRLPRGDVRGVIADVAADNADFGALMRAVAIFARPVLEPALGPELWTLCRPVGFSDVRRTRVLVATASSVAAQETQLRSMELLHCLRQVPGLGHIIGVKVHVDPRPFRD
jgi:hypothetical protein